jgi:acetyl esterase/lipase
MVRRLLALLLTSAIGVAVGAAPVAAGTSGGDAPPPLEVERDVVYRTVNGRDLGIDVYRPGDDTVYPAVLQIHGGGWIWGSKEDDETLARDLAVRGFVVFVVEYRLATTDPYPAAVEDVQAAVEWARVHAGEYGADPDAVGAIGGSAGGHLAALLATLDGSQVDAAVSIAGPMDLADPTVSLATVFFFASFLGCLDGVCDLADAAEASPINHVSGDDAPLFLANSEDDQLVPVTHARRMAAALEAAGVETELVTPPTGGHETGPGPAAYDAGVEFLRRHLGGEPIAAPPAGSSPGGDAPTSDNDRGLELALLVAVVALIAGGVVMVALSRTRRPRSPRGGWDGAEPSDQPPQGTRRRVTTSAGRRD